MEQAGCNSVQYGASSWWLWLRSANCGRKPGVRIGKEAGALGTERANRILVGRKSERKGGEHTAPCRSLVGFWLFSA